MAAEGSPSASVGDARNRTPDERHRIAAAALAEAELTARQPSSGRPARDRARQQPSAADPSADAEADPEADPVAVARDIVLRKLTAQQRSRRELAEALQQRDVPDHAARAVLDRMEEVGLVDDAAFAESWVAARQSRRHLSRQALRQELVRKGVGRDEIDNALSTVEPDDELEAATALAAKKLRSMRGLERDVKYRRLAGALARRGFSAGLTSKVLASVLGSADQVETVE